MKHKGYTGDCWVDEEAGVIRGRVIGTRDVITFQGTTVEDAHREFAESVDDYLDHCAELGREPERPSDGAISTVDSGVGSVTLAVSRLPAVEVGDCATTAVDGPGVV